MWSERPLAERPWAERPWKERSSGLSDHVGRATVGRATVWSENPWAEPPALPHRFTAASTPHLRYPPPPLHRLAATSASSLATSSSGIFRATSTSTQARPKFHRRRPLHRCASHRFGGSGVGEGGGSDVAARAQRRPATCKDGGEARNKGWWSARPAGGAECGSADRQ